MKLTASQSIHNEIKVRYFIVLEQQSHDGRSKIWSKIRHPNILRKFAIYTTHSNCTADSCLAEFLGANIVDDKPFTVMPYLKNGNVRTYLRDHPDSDRLQIVRTPDLIIPVSAKFRLVLT